MRTFITAIGVCVSCLLALFATPPAPGQKAVPNSEKDGGYADVAEFKDFDEIKIGTNDHQSLIALSNVVPLGKWPKELSEDQKKVQQAARAFGDQWLQKQTVFLVQLKADRPKDKAQLADVYRSTFGPTKVEREWKGAAPAEKIMWFGFNFNILLVEEGYSPYVPEKDYKRQKQSQDLFEEAQASAKKNKKGIWKLPELAEQLEKIAAASTKESD